MKVSRISSVTSRSLPSSQSILDRKILHANQAYPGVQGDWNRRWRRETCGIPADRQHLTAGRRGCL